MVIDNDRTLGIKLRKLAALNTEALIISTEIDIYSQLKYGLTPSEADNDTFIDSCLLGCGASKGISSSEFHISMLEAIRRKK